MFLLPSAARAQIIPDGALLLVDNGSGPTSNPYPTANVFNNYTTEFTPTESGANYVLFAFRQVPAFWTFGNAVLTAAGSSVNLFADPNFTHGGSVSAQSQLTAPADWGIVYQSTTTPNAAGFWAPPGTSYANSEPGVNQGVDGSWYDGAVETYDGIYQGVDLTAGTQYTISFALSGNDPAVVPTIEMGVFAGTCVSLSADPTTCVPSNDGFAVNATPGQTQNAGGAPINMPNELAAGLTGNAPTLIPEFDGGTLVLDNTDLTPFSFTITGNNGTVDLAGLSATISNPITDNTAGVPGGLSIIDSGTGGALTFTGVNTYTGATNIGAGAILALGGLGSISTSSDVTDNGVFDITALTDQGTGITTLDGNGSVLMGANNLVLTNAAGTFGGVISGAGQLDLNAGTETLNGANTYTGGTFVNAGTLTDGDAAHPGAVIGGPATVLSGATLQGYGSVAGSLTNSGEVIPGGVGAPGTLTVSGDYTQASTGDLLVAVSPTTSSVLATGGNVTLDGKVTFAYAPGTYSAHTYSFITTPGAISGQFASIVEEGNLPTAFTRTVVYDTTAAPDPVNLVLASPVTTTTTGAAPPPPPVLVIAPGDSGVFSAQNQAMAEVAQTTTSALISQAAHPGSGGADCAAEEGVAQQSTPNSTNSGNIAAAFASAFCRAGGWLRATGSAINVHDQADTGNYHGTTAGILGGADTAIGSGGLRLGIAVGYSQTWLRDTFDGSATADTTSVGFYGSQPVGPALVAGAFSYGHSNNDTTRQTGIGGAEESHGTNIYTGGLQGSLPLMVHNLEVTPAAGVRFASVNGGDFSETAPLAIFAVQGAASNYLSIKPYADVAVTKTFTTDSQIMITPAAALGYELETASKSRSVLLTAADGTGYNSNAPRMDASDALLSAGIAAGYHNWSAFARYTAQISGNWTNQIAQAGIDYRF